MMIGVPFTGCPEGMVATREDEAVAIAVGAWLAGDKPVVYMQDSGIGNCLDVLTSLLIPYGIKIELVIARRLEPEHHRCMGENFEKILELVGYDSFRLY